MYLQHVPVGSRYRTENFKLKISLLEDLLKNFGLILPSESILRYHLEVNHVPYFTDKISDEQVRLGYFHQEIICLGLVVLNASTTRYCTVKDRFLLAA